MALDIASPSRRLTRVFIINSEYRRNLLNESLFRAWPAASSTGDAKLNASVAFLLKMSAF
jgi:hypothetical protein